MHDLGQQTTLAHPRRGGEHYDPGWVGDTTQPASGLPLRLQPEFGFPLQVAAAAGPLMLIVGFWAPVCGRGAPASSESEECLLGIVEWE
jgi:hypothetical protein